MLPRFMEVVVDHTWGGYASRLAQFKASLLQAEYAETNIPFDGVVVDVVLHAGQHQLLIHVRVSKRHDPLKDNKLAALGLSVLDIDLSRLGMDAVLDREAFRHAVLCDLQNRCWLYSVKGARLVDRLRQEIRSEVAHRKEVERERRQFEQAKLRAHNDALRETSRVARIAAFEAQQNSPEVIEAKARLEEIRAVLDRRTIAIAATIRQAVAIWAGTGAECPTCYMVSAPGTAYCGYCAYTGPLVEVAFTLDHADTAYFRMKCSLRPDQSLARIPVLEREPLEEFMPTPKGDS